MRRLEEGQHECTPINRPGFAEHHGTSMVRIFCGGLWSGSVATARSWDSSRGEMGFLSFSLAGWGDGRDQAGSRLASIVDVGESHRLKAPKKGIWEV